jgi:hypothetical protein
MASYVHTQDKPTRTEAALWRRRILWTLAIWGGAVALLGAGGAFAALPLPLLAPLAALGMTAPVAAYAGLPRLRAVVHSWSVESLTAFHLWRIGAAAMFFAYGAAGELPGLFVRNAAWGDLIAGLLVIPALALPVLVRARFLAFHLFGLADFVLAVGTGLAFSLADDRQMATIATFPLVMIPLFGVGVSGASHIIALDLLRRGRG